LERPLRVAVTGSESTGKTTLAAELAAHYGTVWSPEFAREYLDRKGSPLDDSDVEPIARGQITGEDEAAGRATRPLILDTDLVSTVVSSRYYYGRCPEWIAEAARARLADLYLLLHPDVPWVSDGAQRDRPVAREELHALFHYALEAFGARYTEIRGPWPERRVRAIAAIDALLAG
jgi:HTH-type transcriptional regulator, transcriptional repressor of NAD biosynthesis genes